MHEDMTEPAVDYEEKYKALMDKLVAVTNNLRLVAFDYSYPTIPCRDYATKLLYMLEN